MYHHFHDKGRHKPGQGSIDAETFDRVLGATLARGIEILPPEVYMDRARAGRLQPNETALTFDDRLRCQSDIAVPVMEARGLRGFFFLYTATEGPDRTMFEFFRDYRNTFFEDIEAFYALAFETAVDLFDPDWADIDAAVEGGYLSQFPFYTRDDRRFRYLRDRVLGPDRYDRLMRGMMEVSGYDVSARAGDLLMSEADVARLSGAGHVIGLHSHSHPMRMSALTPEAQRQEYATNLNALADYGPIRAVSHPCGDYGPETLEVLRDLGIEIGFRSSPGPAIASTLEIPREDHAMLVKDYL